MPASTRAVSSSERVKPLNSAQCTGSMLPPIDHTNENANSLSASRRAVRSSAFGFTPCFSEYSAWNMRQHAVTRFRSTVGTGSRQCSRTKPSPLGMTASK